jgi:ribosomal protein S18 acetylase RimI-like enzyme
VADFTVRPATDADRPAIAELQIASWRTTYAGLLPDDYLGQPVSDDLHANWQGLDRAEGDVLLVAEATAGGLIGFVYVKDKEGPYVDNLHVRPDCKGQGIGRALMKAAARALQAQGDRSVWLTVMSGNDDALAFYLALGGEAGEESDHLLYGQKVRHRPIRWNDLGLLTQA